MKALFALALAGLAFPAAADNYLGLLKPPKTDVLPTGLYSFASGPSTTFAPLLAPDNGYRFKLGYKYSRYFAVEGEFSDVSRSHDAFANPASLASSFRSTGFGIDTVAMLPVWRMSFYGRLGAYHGERNGLASGPVGLLGDGAARGTRWRYGLGMRYNVTETFGIRAEVERYSLGLGSPLSGDVDADQVTVGVSWRF
jgi:opacity protein-like surface antigen